MGVSAFKFSSGQLKSLKFNYLFYYVFFHDLYRSLVSVKLASLRETEQGGNMSVGGQNLDGSLYSFRDCLAAPRHVVVISPMYIL